MKKTLYGKRTIESKQFPHRKIRSFGRKYFFLCAALSPTVLLTPSFLHPRIPLYRSKKSTKGAWMEDRWVDGMNACESASKTFFSFARNEQYCAFSISRIRFCNLLLCEVERLADMNTHTFISKCIPNKQTIRRTYLRLRILLSIEHSTFCFHPSARWLFRAKNRKF